MNQRSNCQIADDVEIIEPVAIGNGCIIEKESVIGPYTSIGDNVSIGRGSRIISSIIFPNAQIGNFSSINNTIVGEAAIVGKWVKIEGFSMIGDYCELEDNITLANVFVCPWKSIEDSILSPSDEEVRIM